MKILLCGGGTGGHITPSLAVAHELKRRYPEAKLIYAVERDSKFLHLIETDPVIEEIRTIRAGKFRRYHGESWVQRLLDVNTNLSNLRDFIFFVIGTFQSVWLMLKLKPSVVFIKGGFVGVPVGLAAAVCRIPIVTHDSDVMAGLANRLIARWTRVHATGMPAELYPYPPEKTVYTGTPLMAGYEPVTGKLKKDYRRSLDINDNQQVLFVTGGSQGARHINQAVAAIVPDLLVRYPKLLIIHQVGKGNELLYRTVSANAGRLWVHPFIDNMHVHSGAADVVISRASSTTLAELGVQGKPVIIIPSPYLAGGHQLKNADYFKSQKAAIVVQEAGIERNPQRLLAVIERLLDAPDKAKQMAKNFHDLIPMDAAEKLADLIIKQAQR